MLRGTVDFDALVYNSYDVSESNMSVKRSENNVRKRPNGQNRHDHFGSGLEDADNSLSLIKSTDLEWMSFNYRKQRAAKMSPSERRTILIMFEEDYQYFPTLREIRDELIDAQMVELREASKEWTNQVNF